MSEFAGMKRPQLLKAARERGLKPTDGQWLNYRNDDLIAFLETGIDPKQHSRSNGSGAAQSSSGLDEVTELVTKLVGALSGSVANEEQVRAWARDEAGKALVPLTLKVEIPAKGETKDLGLAHKQLPKLIRYLQLGFNVALVGPAASGKTHAAEQAAEALGIGYIAQSFSSQTSKSDLFGFATASGEFSGSLFHDAYKNGKLYLGDEFDAGNANVNVLLNAATANAQAGFPAPEGMVRKHDQFRMVVAMNTLGLGADRAFVGRNKLDAATRTRFVFIDWQYDEVLEQAVVKSKYPDASAELLDKWIQRVHSLRRAVDSIPASSRPEVLVTPRQTEFGAALIADGVKLNEVEEDVIWNAVGATDRKQVEAQAKAAA